MQSMTSKRILTSNLRWELFWCLFDILRQGLWDFWWIILSTHLFLVANPYLYGLDRKLPITSQRWMKTLYHLSLECEFQKNMSDYKVGSRPENFYYSILWIFCRCVCIYVPFSLQRRDQSLWLLYLMMVLILLDLAQKRRKVYVTKY